VPGSDVDWGDDEWRVLEVAAQRPERRARWVDALRSIRDIDGFQRVLASVTRHRGWARPLFQGAAAAVDLRSELEVLGHRLLVGAHADNLLAGGGAAALRQAGRRAGKREPSRPTRSAWPRTWSTCWPTARPTSANGWQRRHRRRRHASAQRGAALFCAMAATHGPAATARHRGWCETRRQPSRQHRCPRHARQLAARCDPPRRLPRVSPWCRHRPPNRPPAAPAAPGDAPHEWTLIQGVPNKLVLVSFSESSGRMVPDRAVVGGFSFVARALGPVQDGRFEVEVASNSGAPVRLRHGQYRVRARLVLDYTREDQCVQGMTCWFSRPELHAKSVPREVVFFMTVASRFVDRRRAEFGTLLPLVADGNARYRSLLKEARLAIESVRFELL
jgi:hypothetical protein